MGNVKNVVKRFYGGIRWKLTISFQIGMILVIILMGFMFEQTFSRYFLEKEQAENFRKLILIDQDINPSQSIIASRSKSLRLSKLLELDITVKAPPSRPIGANDRIPFIVLEEMYLNELKKARSIKSYLDQAKEEEEDKNKVEEDKGKEKIEELPILPFKMKISNEFGMTIGYMDITESKPSSLRTELITLFSYLGLIGLIGSGIIGYILSSKLTRPIREMTDVVQLISDGDFRHKVQIDTNDELGQLGRQFNLMTSQINSSFKLLETERDKLKRIIADLSHELKTPITALSSFNELLLTGADENKEIREEFLTLSREQIDRLRHFTENLLSWSRLDAGVEIQELSKGDIKQPLNRSIQRLRPLANEKGISLFDIITANPAPIMMNERQIEQIFDNLIQNAIKFTSSGGTISVTLEVDQLLKEVKVTVQDNGIGIDRNDIPYVFERFYRGKVQPSESSQGSGLGLAIVKSILELHKGKITLLSERKKGTSFYLVFPIAE